ncbi:MAG TPA: peptide chain release factor 1 [Thermomicrobiales bacterium]|nr:peptide chain release factor 1 [Thermomicrobiales bacterium]
MSTMFETLDEISRRYDQLTERLADPDVATNPALLMEIGSERAEIEEVVTAYRDLKSLEQQIEDAQQLIATESDPDMVALAREELDSLHDQREPLVDRIRRLLVPKDPLDEKNVIVEIRGGAGGEEANLFAAELMRMYLRYAEKQGWKTEMLDLHETGIGGINKAIFEVRGKGAYSHLRYESGVHRVQRVPVTESSGRIHTSTATVAVLPEAEEADVEIDENDLRIDVYRSSGHGGQSVNTTDSAVRITHLPTGIVVTCQDEKSQLKNRAKAMTVLRARLYELEQQRLAEERGELRRGQIGSGERSEKIRTYNFPQDRVTDHRLKKSVGNLQGVLDGNLEPFIDELRALAEAQRLENAGIADG